MVMVKKLPQQRLAGQLVSFTSNLFDSAAQFLQATINSGSSPAEMPQRIDPLDQPLAGFATAKTDIAAARRSTGLL